MKKATYKETEQYWKRPERVVLVTTRKPEGGGNIITLGWKMRTSFKPPAFAISVGTTRYSHELLLAEGEFVLDFPGTGSAHDVLYCGTHSGRTVDKFTETSFTPGKASVVSAPLIEECVAGFECRVTGTLTTGDHTIFAGEVVACWLADAPGPVLLSVDKSSVYRPLAEGAGHILGTIR